MKKYYENVSKVHVKFTDGSYNDIFGIDLVCVTKKQLIVNHAGVVFHAQLKNIKYFNVHYL